jgi:two-component system sensor histidine kinase UhpB
MPQSSPRQRRRFLHALWYGRSVRTQLLLVFVLIDLAAALVAGSVTIWRARTQTRIEMAASIRLAELLVGDAVNLVHQQLPAEQFLAVLPAQLRSLRHVRIAVKDAAGIPIAAAPSVVPLSAAVAWQPRSDERAPALGWFAALVAPPIETHVVPVAADGHSVGQVEITGEPADEIAETWENAVAIGAGALLLNVAMIGVLYVLFGRVLGPLTVLASGLSELEQQTYSVRLPRPPARELAAIAEHFNALALALETVRAENLRLNRRLITAQDDERRRTALELHDEVGPCLFGLKANASSVRAPPANSRTRRSRAYRSACTTCWRSSSICRPSTAPCSTACGRWHSAMSRSGSLSTSSCASVHVSTRR